MFKKYYLVLLLLLVASTALLAQGPTAIFSVGTSFCQNQYLDLQNNSTLAQSYQWDFCLNDFSTLKSSEEVASITGLNGGYGYKLIQDEDTWFGFVTSVNNNKLFRLHYGSSPANTPSITDLGNMSGKLVLPEGIDLVKVNGNWFGFVGSLDFSSPAQGIIRLDFGNSLLNEPTAINLGNFGYNVRFREVKVVKQGVDLILIAINYNDGSIIRINYRGNFNNSIGPGDIFDSGPIANANLPIGIDLVKKGADWIGILASLSNSMIIQLNFGSDVLSIPIVEAAYTFPSVTRPYKVKIVREGNSYYSAISNEAQPITILDFKDLDSSNTPVQLVTPVLPTLLGIDGVRMNGANILSGVSSIGTGLTELIFEAACNVNNTKSTEHTPSNVYYTGPGTWPIELIAIGVDPTDRSVATEIVTVSALMSPDIDFAYQNECALHDIIFTSQNISGDITAYAWNFGDSETSNDQNPVHQYATSGAYSVRLTATADNGCNNIAQQELVIYDKPVANFVLPATTPLCTNQPYLFENTSTYDPNSNPIWSWSVNGQAAGSMQDLTSTLQSGTSSVRLEAAIQGCASEIIKVINNVLDGPEVDFAKSGACEDSSIEFTSTISGSVNSLSWDFGDGQVSNLEDPLHTYTNIGTYNVVLEATNDAGCTNSKIEAIQIYSQPSANFSLALPPFSCAGSPAQFNDITSPLPDSNITGWSWDFGDTNPGTSTEKNPVHTYSLAGDYMVSLQVTTNFGCTGTIEKSINIAQPTTANFTNGPACLSQGTLFTDASGSDVKAWLWTAQNSSYTSRNPTHVFTSTGTHPVTLAVTANNNCVSQVTKLIAVPVPESVNFSTNSTCATLPATFTEITTGGADPAVSWSWDFNGQIGTGSTAQHTFAQVGTYPVKLYSTRQSGCTYAASKNVAIVQPPIAQFTVPENAGAVPFTVGFTNTSSQATNFLWRFNDTAHTTSSEFSPSFVFNQLGEYPVELLASNEAGCTDSFVKSIYVVIPSINAAITDFTLTPLGDGTFEGSVTVLNKSNLAISNPEIFIALSGVMQVKERINSTLHPNQSIQYTLASNLVASGLQYACAQVKLTKDNYAFDDEQCVSLTNESLALQPYPNPVEDELILSWINHNSENLSIAIFSSAGQLVIEKLFEPVLPDLNQVVLDVSALPQGIYFAEYLSAGKRTTYRFAITR